MAWLLDGTLGYLAQNLVVIGVLPYIIGGLSIVHLAAAQTAARLTWLIGFYLFFLMAVNYLSIVLVIIGVADQWIDLKKRVLRLKSQRLGAANSTRKDERNRDNDVADDDDQDR